jgi:uncharacterized RDD family membrane protein YckC
MMMSDMYQTIEGRTAMSLDPAIRPELYEGVRTKRVSAFLIDAAVIFFLMLVASFVITVLGIFTLGLGWLLFPLVWPVVAMAYNAFTLGGPHSATPGMRFMGIEMRMGDGEAMNPAIAVVHAIGFWLSVTFLTPFILLVSLFTPRKQLLQDLVLGTFVIRRPY